MPTWNFVVAGHTAVTPVPARRLLNHPFRPLHTPGRTVIEQLFLLKIKFCQNFWCLVFWHRPQDTAKSCFQWKMLELAAKCSNYAKNSGLCFLFWIILFEAEYAKKYVNNIHRARVNIGWYLASAIWPEVRTVDRVYIFAEPQARQISTRSTVRTEGHITS